MSCFGEAPELPTSKAVFLMKKAKKMNMKNDRHSHISVSDVSLWKKASLDCLSIVASESDEVGIVDDDDVSDDG